MLVDSHCHLDFPDFADDLDAIVARAEMAGIGRIVTISTRVKRLAGLLAIAERFPTPMMQSPSQCPTCTRSPTSTGRSAIIVMLVSRPRRSRPWTRRRRRRRRRFAGRVNAILGS